MWLLWPSVPSKETFLVLAAVIIALVLAFLRASDALLAPQFRVEDGPIFFQQSHLIGWRALVSPYAGYFVTFQRIVAFVASPFGAVYAPDIYVVGWIVALCWSVATIASSAVPHAWIYSLAFMLVPQRGALIASLTNSQWILAAAMVFVVASPAPASRLVRSNQLGLIVVSGLSGPFSILTLPVAAGRLYLQRSRFDWYVASAVGACALIQLAAMALTYQGSHHTVPGDPVMALLSALDGSIGRFIHGGSTDPLMRAGLVTLLMSTLVVIFVGDRQRLWLSLLALFGLLVLLAGWWKYRHSPDSSIPDRFLVLPRTVLLWVLMRGLLSAPLQASMAAICLLSFVLHYRQWHRPVSSRLDWRPAAEALDRGEGMVLRVVPGDHPSGVIVIPPRRGHAADR